MVSITVDGVPLPVKPDGAYYLLYKPVGVISTRHDDMGRPTVVDLVPSDPPVYPVGRLDADSEGLLIVTNDGELTNRLTHPRFGVTKTYVALTTGTLTNGDIKRLESGVELDDGPAAAVSARILDTTAESTLVELVMTEGRNREVRRMVASIGHEVLRLVRIAIGDLKDRDLKAGEWRALETAEVRRLYASAVAGTGAPATATEPLPPSAGPSDERQPTWDNATGKPLEGRENDRDA